ncbi:hypothetical protein GQ55_8G167800 [Panicum hallii var. hallii]|uniref:Leucine-rich repeat-containing N-terminal plant-type domain-containing protein n=1 Tax=Panicum hallii var. hallii TaxID=1504633 RepID=A0A2T7CNH9_9POAL|nr:hypothetical protein GQ55_8G167800 [Panicum hallii var. hallii]
MGMSTVANIFLFALLCQCSHAWMNPSPRNSNATSSDERALLSFKSLLLSAQSGLLASWNTSSHFCGWPGVYCDRRHPERVVALRIYRRLQSIRAPLAVLGQPVLPQGARSSRQPAHGRDTPRTWSSRQASVS